jgi:hypothetical protein
MILSLAPSLVPHAAIAACGSSSSLLQNGQEFASVIEAQAGWRAARLHHLALASSHRRHLGLKGYRSASR